MSKLSMSMEPGYMALSIYYQWMSSRCGSVLDSQPRQGKHMTVQDYYDHFLCWKNKLESVNYINNEEWYVDDFISGLKINLMVRVSRHKWIRRLSDAFRRAEIEEIFLSWEENPVLHDADEVFDDMSHAESAHCDELQEAENVGNEKRDDLVVQLEADNGKFVSLNAYRDVLDELPEPALSASTAFKLIDDALHVYSDLNYREEATYNQVFGNSENGALKMHSKSTVLVFTCLNLSSKQFIENVDGSFFAEQKEMHIAHIMFDGMPMLFSLLPFENIDVGKCYIPLFDCVPQIFDPGTSLNFKDIGAAGLKDKFPQPIIIAAAAEESFSSKVGVVKYVYQVFDKMLSQILVKQHDDMGRQLFPQKISLRLGWRDCNFIESPSVKQDLDRMPSTSIDELCVGMLFMFIFDPGGSSLYYRGCSYIRPNNAQQNCAFCDFWVDELIIAKVQGGWTDLCLHNENNLVYSTFKQG